MLLPLCAIWLCSNSVFLLEVLTDGRTALVAVAAPQSGAAADGTNGVDKRWTYFGINDNGRGLAILNAIENVVRVLICGREQFQHVGWYCDIALVHVIDDVIDRHVYNSGLFCVDLVEIGARLLRDVDGGPQMRASCNVTAWCYCRWQRTGS